MSIGSIVDILREIPEAVGLVKRLVERIKAARPEDRPATIAAMEAGAEHTHAALERVAERLRVARADEPTVTRRINDTGEAD